MLSDVLLAILSAVRCCAGGQFLDLVHISVPLNNRVRYGISYSGAILGAKLNATATARINNANSPIVTEYANSYMPRKNQTKNKIGAGPGFLL